MNTVLKIKDKKLFTKDINTGKFKEWDPFRSKIAAGIKKGMKINLNENYTVLYLGAAEGYTISYIADFLDKGKVYGIDFSPYSMQKLILKAKDIKNLIPILGDCNKPEEYKELLKEKFDVIIQDISQKNQIDILIKNSDLFLKNNGTVILSLKMSAISLKDYKKIKEEQINLFKKRFIILDQKRLDPFEKNHILILGKKK